MIEKIITTYLTAAERNTLYKKGYRFFCKGDYKTLETTDPWSGMPNTTHNIYVFTDKEEAETFAKTQKWVFNPNVTSEVYEIPEHTETPEEFKARQAKIKAERKAKKEAKEREIAEKAGMTLEEYRKEKAKKAQITRIKNEIERLEEELNYKKEHLKRLIEE